MTRVSCGKKSAFFLIVSHFSVELKPNKDITKHEEYFKPTIVATLIERYCMNGTHECIGTTLPIDYSNVIVLKLTYSNEQQRQATVYYTVAKPRNPKLLTVNNTMTPEKIVHILNLTLDKRPDIIGQAKILEHTSAEITVDGAITVAKDSYDHFHENIVFFIFLIVLGLIVGAIYVIAIVKVIRQVYLLHFKISIKIHFKLLYMMLYNFILKYRLSLPVEDIRRSQVFFAK